jgi:hypothetical protein
LVDYAIHRQSETRVLGHHDYLLTRNGNSSSRKSGDTGQTS